MRASLTEGPNLIVQENGDAHKNAASGTPELLAAGLQNSGYSSNSHSSKIVPDRIDLTGGKVARSLFVRPDASIWFTGAISEESAQSSLQGNTNDLPGQISLKQDEFDLLPIEIENSGVRPAVLAFYPQDEQLLLFAKEVRRIEPGEKEIIQSNEPCACFKVVIKVPKIDPAHPWDEEELTTVEMSRGSAYSIEVTNPPVQPESEMGVDEEANDANPLTAAINGLQQVLSPKNEQQSCEHEPASEGCDDFSEQTDPFKRKISSRKSPVSPRSLCSPTRGNSEEELPDIEHVASMESLDSVDSLDNDSHPYERLRSLQLSQEQKWALSVNHSNSGQSASSSTAASSKCENGPTAPETGSVVVDDVSVGGIKQSPLVWRANLGDAIPQEIQIRLRDGQLVSLKTCDLQDGKCQEVLNHFDSVLHARVFQNSDLRPRPIVERQVVLLMRAFFVGAILTFAATCISDLAPVFLALNVVGASLLLAWGGLLPWLHILLVKCTCYGLQWHGCSPGVSCTLQLQSMRTGTQSNHQDVSSAEISESRKASSESTTRDRSAVVDFSGTWELEVERSDDPSDHLQALGASWVEQQLARGLKRTIVIRQVGKAWSETMCCSVVSKTTHLVLDGSEQQEVNPFDGSSVTMQSTIEEDGHSVMTKRIYSKSGHVQHTVRRLVDSGSIYSISHDLRLACGKVLTSTFYYKKK